MLSGDASDVMAVLDRLLAVIRGDGWGRFTEGYPMTEAAKNIPAPIVTWRLLTEEPGEVKGRVQRKPRVMFEEAEQGDQEGRVVFYQPIEAEVRIGCWHTTTPLARELSRHVQELMTLYGAQLQKAGAAQLFWTKTTSEIPESDRWRTDLVAFFLDYRMLFSQRLLVRRPLLHQVSVEVEGVASTLATAKNLFLRNPSSGDL